MARFKLYLLLPILRCEVLIKFRRKVAKKVTNTGHDSYVVSIPREIAEELRLPDGGLVSLRVWGHRGEVLMQNYEDSLHPYQEVIDLTKLAFVDAEIEPKTRGRSRGFAEGLVLQTPRQFLQETKALCRYLDATRPAHRRRRKRRR